MSDPYVAAGARPVGRSTEIRGGGYETQQASDLADLSKKYADAERQRLEIDRLRSTPLPQAPKSGAQQARETMQTTRAQEIAKASAAKEFSLPKIEADARRALQQGSALVKHPGFEATVGLPNPFRGGLGVGTVPGTTARDFTNALDRAKAGAFMQAFESLKGGGAISEREGEAATRALAAMETSTSEGEFKSALQQYMDIVATGVQTARKQAGMGSSPFSYEALMREKQRRQGGR